MQHTFDAIESLKWFDVAWAAWIIIAMILAAFASSLVGKLIAVQDRSSVSKAEAMRIVALNMEAGNRQMVEEMQRCSRPN